MKRSNSQNNKDIEIKEICEICGEEMDENPFAYDYDSENKLVFKCPACGHRKVRNL
ncbi:hypothetical protein ACSXBA_09895 [Clostridium perfringens]|uniref:hypothetical protein n=1 Tax=Clostridium perfringens TaxID=1502 RepID=UPI0013E37C7F|nr:hypothetical protein [Clostridium perfringens]EHK2337891.1 hypothetical protein [Clostridium perfringens]EIF5083807.1 hypothetical protein [Clostridium perfringens]MBO3339678.1 hypothetical protein [Clostridium perfringens]MDB2051796.1 hypothetical protein [Clostridium perfringens]MDH2338078.1 hypothetical protein [Clostridium perfringens]